MKNPLVTGHEAEDIDIQIAKLIRGLGNPEPPLRLEDVRAYLDLDRQYFSSTDNTFIRETVHDLKVAGKRIFKRAVCLFEAIRKADLRALFLPDKRRILIDEELPDIKHRWAEGHEIGHSIIPWHQEFLLGDSETELSPTCFATIEAEANYADGKLLFLRDRFEEEVMSGALTIDRIKGLADQFGNTKTSTLWRFVEEYRGRKPLVGIVSGHPRKLPEDFDPLNPCRHTIQSSNFRRWFSSVSEIQLFEALRSYCGFQRGGPLGSDEVTLLDDNGDAHRFEFETFFFHHYALTLGVHERKLSAVTA